jgi:hypothetical protein
MQSARSRNGKRTAFIYAAFGFGGFVTVWSADGCSFEAFAVAQTMTQLPRSSTTTIYSTISISDGLLKNGKGYGFAASGHYLVFNTSSMLLTVLSSSFEVVTSLERQKATLLPVITFPPDIAKLE